MQITFLGAAGCVTGSSYLVEGSGTRFLVDCGLFQGLPAEELKNFDDFAFNPADIDFMILTHAHIDHSGRIPLLVKRGFKGQIFCTFPTRDLAEILLQDSAKIQEADVTWENKKRQRAGLPKQDPLYSTEDAISALSYLYPIPYHHVFAASDSVHFTLYNAGHLLGSAFVEIKMIENGTPRTLVFSGDLGAKDVPLLKPLETLGEADILIIESTYGNRYHKNPEYRIKSLIETIVSTAEKGGTTLIPSFAVGRTQEIIFEMHAYIEDQGLKDKFLEIPVYADSPLAIEATSLFLKHTDELNSKVHALIQNHENPLKMPNLKLVKNPEESIALNRISTPKVILSASGMCDAGRIQHHLKHYLWKPETSVVFVGYQAEGTLGRLIKEGADHVRILDADVKINANIVTIEGFSGHADLEDLSKWLTHFKKIGRVFVTHGEKEASTHLKQVIEAMHNCPVDVPLIGDSFTL